MKIAIPSDDNVNICGHFGRTRGFKIVEIENGKVVKDEFIDNTFTGHVQGNHEQHQHQHDEKHQMDTHAKIFSALDDVKVVIANGMGRRLYDDFQQRNIQIFITKETVISNAIEGFIANTLDHNEDSCCEH